VIGWGALIASALAAAVPSGEIAVPTVECPADGQQGPQPAAPPSAPIVHVRADLAPYFAFYRSSELGVLAPRGWHCLLLSGSDGSVLAVTPQSRNYAQLRDLRGPVVQLTFSYGGTSGRFAVARAIARLFPEQREFARQVAAEELDDRPLPSGPYPDDVISRQGPHLVRYRTPAGRQGLGTDSGLSPDDEPIEGVVILMMADGEPDLLQLSVRLPPGQTTEVEAIVDLIVETLGSDLRPTD
jgi:hypothetical protein